MKYAYNDGKINYVMQSWAYPKTRKLKSQKKKKNEQEH